MGARLSVRRKKSRVAQQVPERRRRISSQSRPRFRSPQRESHPYDDVYSAAARESGPYDEVLHSADVCHNPRCESQQYDDVFLSSVRVNEVSYSPRRALQPCDDVFSSPPQRALLPPPRIPRGAYGVRSGGERQSREGTMRYRDYYNLDLVREPTGSSRSSQGHGRASRSQVRESAGYVTPNAVAQWQVAAFKEELARERSESTRKNSMQRPVRKYTFQSHFEKT